ncbi:MAG: alpha/beta hydrolase fold domain-containing protein [Coprococcus eutactus]
MGSQNYLNMAFEKLGHIMLDDMRMKASDIYKLAVKRQKKQDYNPPVYNENKINIRSVFEKGGMCFYVTPKNASVKEYFMFLHEGGFVSQMSRNEWRFVLDTVESTGYGAVVPVYPIAPDHSAAEAVDMLAGAYEKLCEKEDANRIVLIGDSSGACLALSVAIQLWKTGIRRPDKLILCSPVLDTEFEDRELEQEMGDRRKFVYGYYYTPEIRSFLRQYWVKDSEGKVDVTSPVYSDLTDICDEIDIFTSDGDMLNCYARRLYDKIKRTSTKVNFYQYYSVVHDYFDHPYIPECKTVIKKIVASIKGDSDFVPADIENDIWCRAMMAERYPKLYEDSESIRLADKIGIEHKNRNSQYTFYDRTVIMERLVAMDDRVGNFINRYADGIIVNVGAELDTMFGRVDNGRIKWYNVDLPERIDLRRKYMDTRDREVNIGENILDYRWLEQITKPRDTAILFVLYDMTKYFDRERLKGFLNAVWRKFPGAEVVFDAKNSVAKRMWNINVFMGRNKGSMLRFSIDNCTSLMYDWNVKYKILCDETIFRGGDLERMLSPKECAKFRHSIKKKYDKIIHLRLGTEHFLV